MPNNNALDDSAESKLPRCLFVTSDEKHKVKIQKELYENGILAIFTHDENRILAELSRPECFLVFVTLKKYPAAISLVQNQKTNPNKYFVAIENSLKTSQSSKLYSVGFIDILTMPVHPFNYKSKTRQLLTRFVQNIGMPDDIILPPGVGQTKEHTFRIEDDSDPEPTVLHTVHDLTPDKGPTWNIHESSNIDSKAAPQKNIKFVATFGEKSTSLIKIDYFTSSEKLLRPVQTPFKIINSEKEKNSFFAEAEKIACDAIVWTHHQKWKKNFKVISYTENSKKILLEYPEDCDPVFLKDLLETLNAKQVFVGLELRRGRIFFAENYSSISFRSNGILLNCNNKIFQTQRRKHFRLSLKNSSGIDAKIGLKPSSDPISIGIEDISAGGCQLIEDKTLVAKFKTGMTCPNIEFSIYGRNISCSGVVRWIKENNVGIQFMHLSDENEEGIQLFVFEESYTYLKYEAKL